MNINIDDIVNKIKNNPFVQKVQDNFQESPAATLMGTAAVIASVAKLIDAFGGLRSRNAYANDSKRRAKASSR